MNPDIDNQNHFNLPPPLPELPPAGQEASEAASTMEQLPAPNPETSGNRPAPAATAQDDSQIPALAVPDPLTQQVSDNVITAVPVQATADEPLIDKAWILKAKRIVEKTADDPFTQNNQLAIVKADYLQKRYGKVVKITE